VVTGKSSSHLVKHPMGRALNTLYVYDMTARYSLITATAAQ